MEVADRVIKQIPIAKARKLERKKMALPATGRARIWDYLTTTELFMIGYSLFIACFAIVLSARLPQWDEVLWRSALYLGVIAVVNLLRSKIDLGPMKVFHAFYVVPLVPVMFKTVELVSYPLHGVDYDHLLIAVDRMLFGTDPTVWLYRTIGSFPPLTEYLQISYSLFYFLPVLLAGELYVRRVRRAADHSFDDLKLDEMEMLRFAMVYGFLLSYLGYIILPAIGPRFFLHDFWAVSKELPGLWATETLRDWTNTGENVLRGMTSQQAQAVVTRDAFPSGHTDLTIVTMILAFRFRAKSRWLLLVLGSSLIFATVYLRYHYVIDVIAGAVLAIVTLYTWEAVHHWLYAFRRRRIRRSTGHAN